LQSTISISKVISDPRGTGSPPNGDNVYAFPYTKFAGQDKWALSPLWSYRIARSQHLKTSEFPRVKVFGKCPGSDIESVIILPSINFPTQCIVVQLLFVHLLYAD